MRSRLIAVFLAGSLVGMTHLALVGIDDMEEAYELLKEQNINVEATSPAYQIMDKAAWFGKYHNGQDLTGKDIKEAILNYGSVGYESFRPVAIYVQSKDHVGFVRNYGARLGDEKQEAPSDSKLFGELDLATYEDLDPEEALRQIQLSYKYGDLVDSEHPIRLTAFLGSESKAYPWMYTSLDFVYDRGASEYVFEGRDLTEIDDNARYLSTIVTASSGEIRAIYFEEYGLPLESAYGAYHKYAAEELDIREDYLGMELVGTDEEEVVE